MRSWALGKGFSLNEYGLKKLKDIKNAKDATHATHATHAKGNREEKEDILIPCKTEEEVFRILNYPYKTPEQRDI